MRHIIFKIAVVLAILAFIIVISIYAYRYILRHLFDIEEPYYAVVVDVLKDALVILDNDKAVGMAGVHVPYKKDSLNYMPDLLDKRLELLKDKRVKVELVERRRTGGAANYDLVRIYLENGICINDYMLENGLAFFDHGYDKNKDHYLDLEFKAKQQRKAYIVVHWK